MDTVPTLRNQIKNLNYGNFKDFAIKTNFSNIRVGLRRFGKVIILDLLSL